MSLSGIFKFLLGFAIAIALLVGGGVAVALYFVTKLTAPPPKPVFANDKPLVQPKSAPVAARKPTPAPAAASPASTPTATPVAVQPSATPTPAATASPKPLEPGTYKARITWPDGLIIRNSPGIDSERIGGVAYNQQVIVLSESEDKRWIKIRTEESNEEGWVKGGNLQRVELEQTQATNE